MASTDEMPIDQYFVFVDGDRRGAHETIEGATQAAQKLKRDHPNRRITVYDRVSKQHTHVDHSN